MNDQKLANLERINELWELHKHEDNGSGTEGRCLAFVIDGRYLDRDGLEWRLGVSFGHNVVTPESKQGFLPIRVHPGEFVFGVHVVANKGNQLSLYEKWMDARPAGDCTDAKEGEKMARDILQSICDADYLASVGELKDEKGPLKVSNLRLLEAYEVVEAEAF